MRLPEQYWTDDGTPMPWTGSCTVIPDGEVRWICDPRSNEMRLQQLVRTLGDEQRWLDVQYVTERVPSEGQEGDRG